MDTDLIVFIIVVCYALLMGTILAAAVMIPPYEIPPFERADELAARNHDWR